jgi:hypothetical protein
MTKKDTIHTLVSYENTLYDLLVSEIKGKYFQNYLNPHLIVQFPKENELGIHLIDDNKLSAWFPLMNGWEDIRLEEFNLYVEITEEQFNKYKKEKTDLSNVVLAHKNSDFIKENHKPNLSEKDAASLKNVVKYLMKYVPSVVKNQK